MTPRCPYCECPRDPALRHCGDCGRELERLCRCGTPILLPRRRCERCGRSVFLQRHGRKLVLVAVVLVGALLAGLVWFDRSREGRHFVDLRARATLLYETGDHTAALPLLDEYLKAWPRDVGALTMRGRGLLDAGRFDEAEADLRRALEIRPSLVAASATLGRHLISAGRPQEALDLVLGSNQPALHEIAARAFLALGRLPEAAAAYDSALRGVMESVPLMLSALDVHERLAGRRWTGAAAHAARANTLLEELERIAAGRAEADPSDHAAKSLLACIRVRLDRGDVATQERQLRSVLAAAPTNSSAPPDRAARRALLLLLVRSDRIEDARAALPSAALPHVEAALDLAAALIVSGDSDAAVEILRAELAGAGAEQGPRLRTRLVQALVASGDAAAAWREAQIVLLATPDDVDALRQAARAAQELGRTAESDRLLDHALEQSERTLDLLALRVAPHVPSLATHGLDDAALAGERQLYEELRARDPLGRESLGFALQIAEAAGRESDAAALFADLQRLYPDDEFGRLRRFGRACAGGEPTVLERVVLSLTGDAAPARDDIVNFVTTAIAYARFDAALRVSVAGVERLPDDEQLSLVHARALAAAQEWNALREHVTTAADGRLQLLPEARGLLARSLARTGRPREAEAIVADLLARGFATAGDLAAIVALGGNVEEAADLLSTALIAEDSLDNHLSFARRLLAEDRVEEAIEHYETALSQDPASAAAILGLGEALLAGDLTDPRVGERLDDLVNRLRDRVEWSPEVLYLAGHRAGIGGDEDLAIEHLSRYVRIRPHVYPARYQLANYLILRGDLDRAIEELRVVIAHRPEFVEARRRLAAVLYQRARDHARSRDLAGVRSALVEALLRSPPRHESASLLATANLGLGHLELAERQVRFLRDQDPTAPGIRQLLAYTLAARGEYTEAAELCDTFLRESPDDALVLVTRAVARVGLLRPVEALADLDTARDGGYSGADAARVRVAALFALDRHDDALAVARAAADAEPDSVLLQHTLAQALSTVGEPVEAARTLLRVVDRQGAETEWLRLPAARLLLGAGDLKGAVQAVGDPDATDPEALILLGDIALARDDEAAAVGYYRAAAEHSPDGHLRLAGLHERAGRAADAIDAYTAALETGAVDIDVVNHLGVLQLTSGEREKARALFEVVLAADPDHLGALNNLAGVLADDDHDIPRAEALVARALELAPGRAEVLDTAGWVALRSGRHEDARRLLTAALEAGAEGGAEADALYHLGHLHAATKRPAQARESFRAALELSPDAAWAAEARRLLAAPR